MSDLSYHVTVGARSLRRPYTVPSTVSGARAPSVKPSRNELSKRPLSTGAANGSVPWLAHAASLFCVEKTTSGHPLPAWLKASILVWKEPEPSAPPS